MESVLTRLVATRPSLAQMWSMLNDLPGGKLIFSKLIGRMAPYTGTIDCRIQTLEFGHAEVLLPDRPAVRNHLNSLHAVALMNLGELCTGLAVMYGVDGRGRGIIRSLKMDYLKKARGEITATCDVSLPNSRGNHDLNVEALLHNTDGELVARARAVWKVTLD